MKFAIDFGHNVKNDRGAVGVNGITEDELTKKVGMLLMEFLIKEDHQVVNVTPEYADSENHSLRRRVSVANATSANVFVSIHFNAFDGSAYGSEVFAVSRVGQAIAQSVLDEIVELGFYNRGVKSANFYVLKHTNMPAILVECCFVDSTKDMAKFNARNMAKAIAIGLIGGVVEKETTSEPAMLTVTQPTVLKPSTKQSYELPTKDLVAIPKGTYEISEFLHEEGHYCVRFVDGSEFDSTCKYFIYAGFSEISTID